MSFRVARLTSQDRLEWNRVLTAGLAAGAVGAAAALAAPTVLLALAAMALFVFVAARPIWAAYLYLAALPFIGGIDRGVLIPLMRPSEGLQAYLMAAVLGGVVYRCTRGETLRVRITRLDRAIVALCLLGSLWPLTWMLARGQTPTAEDVFSTFTLWRLAALYVLFRWVVRTPAQIRRCLWILLAGSCVLAVIALLQSSGLITVGGMWTPTHVSDATGRGGATLASSIAVGDYLAYSVAVVLVLYLRRAGPRLVLAAIAGVLILGSLGTGQFSAWIALFLVVAIVILHEGQPRQFPVWLLPVAVLAAAVAWPVITTRLAGFSSGLGVPSSWLGRIDNLTNFYLPRLGGFNWVLGVRPDSVLPAPETWRDVIYLESGVLWFFWVGGIPLFLGFVWFVHAALRHTRQVARARADDIGVVALAVRAALWSIIVLSVIDMHLTLRGGGDLFFILLGISANRLVPVTPPERDGRRAPPAEPIAWNTLGEERLQ
jgi:hypothetical protein